MPADHVRIIGGQWKRTPLKVPDLPGLRPTPDRVRETVFNWLGQQLDGWVCADLFAGTGALGFEAASRGAASVTMVEQHPQAFAHLEQTRTRLHADAVTLVRGDAMHHAGRLAESPGAAFDVVFLDPPFNAGWLPRILPLALRMLAPSGQVYVECESPIDVLLGESGLHDGVIARRYAKAGQVHYYLLQHNG